MGSRFQWRPSSSRWRGLAARTPSATQCPAPGRGDRLRTLWRLVPKLLLLPRPLLPPLAAVLPFGYGYGLGYHGIGYPAVTYAAPTVTEVEVPQYKFVPQEK